MFQKPEVKVPKDTTLDSLLNGVIKKRGNFIRFYKLFTNLAFVLRGVFMYITA